MRGKQRVVEGALRLGRTLTPTGPPLLAGGAAAQYWYRAEANVGDALSPVFMGQLLGVRPLWVRGTFPGKLLGMGSIVSRVQPGDVVIGSGSIAPVAVDLPPSTTVHWVRGPLTRRCLGDARVPEVYGDPGLLLGDLMEHLLPHSLSFRVDQGRIGVIPHFVDSALRQAALCEADVTVLDVQSPPQEFLALLRGCEAVVSSSLHGIVFAEALGIPALWASPHKDIKGGRFKFDDYFLGTGRERVEPLDFPEALEVARSGGRAIPAPDLARCLPPLRARCHDIRAGLAAARASSFRRRR